LKNFLVKLRWDVAWLPATGDESCDDLTEFLNFTSAPLPPETRVALGVLQGQSGYPCYWYSNPRLLEKVISFFFLQYQIFLENLIKSRNQRDN